MVYAYIVMLNHFLAIASHPAWARASFLGAVLLVGLLSAAPSHGLTVVPRSFDELVQLADTVIVGTVHDMHSEFADNGLSQNILSFVTFDELQEIKGPVNTQQYTLQVPGGVVGRVAQDYPGIPLFQVGQRYVVFIRGNRRDFFPVVGVTQGVYRVLTDGQGRQAVVRDDVANRAVLNRALSTVTRTAPTLDSFVQDIRDRLSATGGNSP